MIRRHASLRSPRRRLRIPAGVATGHGQVGSKAFFVLRLGARLANMYPRLWPRLDLIPGCPQMVAQAVLAAIPHP